MNKKRKALLKEGTECYIGYFLYESDKYSSDIQDGYSHNYTIFKDYRSSYEDFFNIFSPSAHDFYPMELE